MEGVERKSGRECIETLLEEVADREGVEPQSLPPLYDAVDPDALERIVDTSADELRLHFSYCGYRITVGGDGSVSITDEN